MDRATLEDYPYIVAEIKDLKEEINIMLGGSMLTDIVTGSSPEHPYTQHPVMISGVKDSEKLYKFQQRLAHLEELKRQIEDFVDHLPNSRIRRIVKMKAFKRMTWGEIADEEYLTTGKIITLEALRSTYRRFVKI